MLRVPPYTVTFLPYFETADTLFLSLIFFENLLNQVDYRDCLLSNLRP